jgi:pilus assembly protein CpaE
MLERPRVLVASRSQALLDAVDAVVPVSRFSVRIRKLVNGDFDPLEALERPPDILVVGIMGDGTRELEALADYPGPRVPVIVIGEALAPQAMRLAMRAGARDFLDLPLTAEALDGALRQLEPELDATDEPQRAHTIALVGAKGGVGTTTLAVNVAHRLQVVSKFTTVLVDLDLRYGPLYHYLDLHPRRGLLDALDAGDELDGIALDAYLTTHDSGIQVLPVLPASGTEQGGLPVDRFISLVNLIQKHCERLVFDLPSHLEELAHSAVERADVVVVVVQQSLPCLRNAVLLLDRLERQHAVAADRIIVAVNRFHKAAAVTLDDIESALGPREFIRIPDQDRMVAESIEMGLPLGEHAPNAAVTRAIGLLEQRLGGRMGEPPRSFMSRTLSSLLRN